VIGSNGINVAHELGHRKTKIEQLMGKLISSVYKQYVSSWSIQLRLLKQAKISFFSIKNDMLWYHIFQAAYLTASYIFFDLYGFIIVFFSAISGFLLLETINYIEHYGLRRKKTASGRYERVREVHSWNSNHIFGPTSMVLSLFPPLWFKVMNKRVPPEQLPEGI